MTYWKLFHKLWTWSVGKPGYNKKLWRELEKAILASPLRETKVDIEDDT